MSEPKLKLIIKFKMHSATFTCILLPYEQKSVRCQSYMYFILDYNFCTCTYHKVKSAYKPSVPRPFLNLSLHDWKEKRKISAWPTRKLSFFGHDTLSHKKVIHNLLCSSFFFFFVLLRSFRNY